MKKRPQGKRPATRFHPPFHTPEFEQAWNASMDARAAGQDAPFPAPFDTPQFRAAWAAWMEARQEEHPGKKITARVLTTQMRFCTRAKGGVPHATAMLEEAAERAWLLVKPDWVQNPQTARAVATATAAYFTPETPAPRPAWQIDKDLARLRSERSSLWRSDFESNDGRAKYAVQWEKCLALATRIKALESELSAAR